MLLLTWFLSVPWEGGEETKVMAFSDQGISASLLPLHTQIPGPVIPSGCRTSSLSLLAFFTGKGTLNVPKLFLAFWPSSHCYVVHHPPLHVGMVPLGSKCALYHTPGPHCAPCNPGALQPGWSSALVLGSLLSTAREYRECHPGGLRPHSLDQVQNV